MVLTFTRASDDVLVSPLQYAQNAESNPKVSLIPIANLNTNPKP